jgi:predicted nuclease of predicted toxin-antitoxin system
MKLLVDMNLSPAWVAFLAEAGHEALHWSGIGLGTETDVELLAWASDRGYVILTADLDFGAILAASGGTSPSVVQIRSDILTVQAVGAVVTRALVQARQELVNGALVSVDAKRARLRLLPLR